MLRISAICSAVAVSLGAWQTAQAQGAPSEATVAEHVANAKRLADDELKPLLGLCQPAPAKRASQHEIDERLAKEIARPAPEPGKAFDNLYYVGAAFVSAWAIKTSQGVILIDALNNPKEAAALIDPGMRKLGLDPAQIKYVIVTHAHGDHYGGATYFAQKYGSRVVMSDADWKQTETKLEANSSLWGPVPKRDVTVNDGDKVTLGDTAVTIHVTPGHTLGTISPSFDVTSGGKPHHVLLWGGTAFNFGNNIPRLESYAAETDRLAKFAQEQGIDVMISNHAGYDGAFAKLDALRKQHSMEPNPFVLGTPTVVRALQTMGECARAQRDRFALAR
jgi:metallo-beta-lactamase class B